MNTLFELPPALPRHPASYTDRLLPVFARILRTHGAQRILDPFGGTGKVFRLELLVPGLAAEAVELEPEWVACHPRTTLGNALDLPWPAGSFDAIVTSPCYGNRCADHHAALDRSRRNTYRHCLGRPLHPDNAGSLQWGNRYRDFHRCAWIEARRVLRPGALFVLNVSDHVRAGQLMPVSAWHVETLHTLGFGLLDEVRVPTPRLRHGANRQLRAAYESVFSLRLLPPPDG